MFRKILLFLLAALVIIQFIRPKKNKSEGAQPHYIGNVYAIPADVKVILAKACNDCHSNNTHYPWYSKIQPVYWWLNKHIINGKKHINYDEFTHRKLSYQYHKMEETVEMVEDNIMPLNSYTWIHKDAILDSNEKAALIGWAHAVMDTMKARYPADSLVMKRN